MKDNNLNEQVATEENQFSTIKRSPHLKSSSMESDKSDINDRQEKEDNIDDIPNQAVKKGFLSIKIARWNMFFNFFFVGRYCFRR